MLCDGRSFGAKEVGYLLLREPDGLACCIELDFEGYVIVGVIEDYLTLGYRDYIFAIYWEFVCYLIYCRTFTYSFVNSEFAFQISSLLFKKIFRNS